MANGIEPTALNHRAPGYGIIKFDRSERGIEFANWPRWVDASEPGAEPYPGWPVRIKQIQNGLPKGFSLPQADTGGVPGSVVQVVDEGSGEVVYTLRIQGTEFTPTVGKARILYRTGDKPRDRGDSGDDRAADGEAVSSGSGGDEPRSQPAAIVMGGLLTGRCGWRTRVCLCRATQSMSGSPRQVPSRTARLLSACCPHCTPCCAGIQPTSVAPPLDRSARSQFTLKRASSFDFDRHSRRRPSRRLASKEDPP